MIRLLVTGSNGQLGNEIKEYAKNISDFEQSDSTDGSETEKLVDETHLLKLKQLKKLFRDGKIYKEKYYNFTKSVIMVKY